MSVKVIVCVTTDLVTDQRIKKVCASLINNGFDIELIGRKLKNSLPLARRDYPVYRFNLWFDKGPLFYLTYNLRLFFYLLFSKASIFVANDLDTLLAVYCAAKIKGVKIVYDNHEYFTGMPELVHRPVIKKIWKTIERIIFPRLTFIMTDNHAKKKLFEDEYKIPLTVVRNVPVYEPNNQNLTIQLAIPEDKNILIYQGAGININRGAEELTLAMKYLDDNYILYFVGSGDVIEDLKRIVADNNLQRRVIFTGKVPLEQLKAYTQKALLGFTLDKPVCENYTYSLPNKLFDYVHAGVPVLGNRLQEVEYMISTYKIGDVVDSYEPEHIAEKIKKIIENKPLLEFYRSNLDKAAKEINWQHEEIELIKLYNRVKSTL